jgi:Zn-dependent protease
MGAVWECSAHTLQYTALYLRPGFFLTNGLTRSALATAVPAPARREKSVESVTKHCVGDMTVGAGGRVCRLFLLHMQHTAQCGFLLFKTAAIGHTFPHDIVVKVF